MFLSRDIKEVRGRRAGAGLSARGRQLQQREVQVSEGEQACGPQGTARRPAAGKETEAAREGRKLERLRRVQ